MNLSDMTYRKYVATHEVDEYEILSDTGFVDLKSVSLTVPYDVWEVRTECGRALRCADTHILFRRDMSEVYACDLLPGDEIVIAGGYGKVESVNRTGEIEQMCDTEVGGNNRFYTNGVLSHNSLVLANLAVRATLNGANVGIFTVELGDRKYVKRVGSNLFHVNYEMYSQFIDEDNIEPIRAAIDQFKKNNPNAGELVIKEYPTGGASSIDVENYFLHVQQQTGKKFDLIVVDYINLLKPTATKGGDDTLYSKVKKISEELRRIAIRNEWCVVSATQVKTQYFNSDELYLDSTAESSGLVATVDSLFGITGEPGAPRIKIKNLANRDEGHMDSYKYYLKVKEYFRLVEDTAADSEYWSEDGGEELEKAIREEYRTISQPDSPGFNIAGSPLAQKEAQIPHEELPTLDLARTEPAVPQPVQTKPEHQQKITDINHEDILNGVGI